MSKDVTAEHRLALPEDVDDPIGWADIDQREQARTILGSKDPAAAALGRKGGTARAASMTPERRAEIAKLAAAKRWAKR